LTARHGLGLLVPPYKVWAYPYSAIVMVMITLGLVVGLYFEDTLNCIYSLLILALAIPFITYSKNYPNEILSMHQLSGDLQPLRALPNNL
jgi:hypothetical protein